MNTYTFTITTDYNSTSPRDYDNLGTIATWHSKYKLGDIQPKKSCIRFLKTLPNIVSLPVYMYHHSGISLSTIPFNCTWDSGQVGLIYVTFDKIKTEFNFKHLTIKRKQLITKYLQDEVVLYNRYLNNEVYKYTITDKDNNSISSIGDYYNKNDAIHAAESDISSHINADILLQ